MKFLFCLLALVLLAQSAQAQVPATGAGRGALPGNIKVGGGGGGGGGSSYVGPGNVVSGALVWYGFRAYNNTLANSGASTTKVADVLGTVTATGCTIFLKGDGTGDVDLTTSGAGGVGSQCASGATTFCNTTNSPTGCSISKMYDQSGASSCSAACPLIQATAGVQPLLMFSCVGSIPCAQNDNVNRNMASTATLGASSAQPISMSGVANSAGGSQEVVIATSNGGDAQFYFSSDTVTSIYAGAGPLTATYVLNSTIALNDVANGASSVINNDGTETTGSAGTTGWTSAKNVFFLKDGFGNTGKIKVSEAGTWATGFSGANRTALCQNQQAYYGSVNFGATC